jgi:hypothetical protein
VRRRIHEGLIDGWDRRSGAGVLAHGLPVLDFVPDVLVVEQPVLVAHVLGVTASHVDEIGGDPHRAYAPTAALGPDALGEGRLRGRVRSGDRRLCDAGAEYDHTQGADRTDDRPSSHRTDFSTPTSTPPA